jgi:hypothetical protein
LYLETKHNFRFAQQQQSKQAKKIEYLPMFLFHAPRIHRHIVHGAAVTKEPKERKTHLEMACDGLSPELLSKTSVTTGRKGTSSLLTLISDSIIDKEMHGAQ